MKDISSCTERELGMEQSAEQSRALTDRTNCIDNCIGVASNYYFKRQLQQDTQKTQNQQMSEVDVQRHIKIPEDISSSFVQTGYNIPCYSYSYKDCSQNVKDTTNWNNHNTFDNYASEIDWGYISKNLVKTSRAAGLSNYSFTSASLPGQFNIDKSRNPRMLQRITSLDAGEESGRCDSYDSHDRDKNCVIIARPINRHKVGNGILHGDGVDWGLYEERSSPFTSQAPGIRRLYDQGCLFPTQMRGIFPESNPLFCEDVSKIQDCLPLSTSANHVDHLRESRGARRAEGDYLFSEDLVRKRKFRLLIDKETENQMRAEFNPPCLRLSDIIVLKYHSVGIPVQVEEYQREYQDNINVKSFNILFENSRDVSKAFSLTHNGKLLFSLREARPSPSYHVKYEVIHPVGVFEGKCFRKQQIHQLQKGDVVTANQLKGNKVRIIKFCPAGYKTEFDLPGWVLLKTKDIVLVRRMDHWWEKESVLKSESRSAVVKPLLLNQKILGQPRTTDLKLILHETNPQRVSAANCSPFKALVEVEVRKGRKEPAIVGRLKPGRIVWANQHKGSMLRVVKMDHYGNIVVDANSKPEIWGWVCLQRRGNEKPHLVRIPASAVAKTKKFVKMRRPCDKLIKKCHIFADNRSQHQPKEFSNERKTRTSKVAEVSWRLRGTKHFNKVQLNHLENGISGSRQVVQAKSMLKRQEDKVVIPSSPNYFTNQILSGRQRGRGNLLISDIGNTFLPTTIHNEIQNRIIRETRGQVKPYLLQHIPGTMNYSRSVSPMSISSI